MTTPREHAGLRRALVVALAAGAVACLLVGFRSDKSASGASPKALTTPAWSPRRVPQPVVDAAGAQRLATALQPSLTGNETCVDVDDAVSGDAITEANPEKPLIPASTQKLLTGAAALQVLGADHRFDTTAVAKSAPQNGVIENVWLIGGGDPVLATSAYAVALDRTPLTKGNPTTSLASLAEDIAAAGVKSIPGGVAADDSRYDATRYLPSWPASYRAELGPIGALTVDGGKTSGGGNVGDPAIAAATQLTQLLAARGVTVGGPSRGSAPAGAVTVGQVSSPPLRDIVAGMLRSSDNLTAEMLTREVAVATGKPGSTANGVDVIALTLRQMHLPTKGLHLVDGSGLDRQNRATCSLLLATLRLGSQPAWNALWEGLSVAAQQGTLAPRLVGTPLAGALRAKTGSLNGVTGLVGIVNTGRPLEFAFLANGKFSEAAGFPLRERVASVVSSYPNAPDAVTLVPAP